MSRSQQQSPGSPGELARKQGLQLFRLYVHVVQSGVPVERELYYDHDHVQGWFHHMTVKLNDGIAVSLTPGCRVLVVDDNRDSAKTLSMMLRIMGYIVQQAHDGDEALQVAADFRPDVVLLDIGLPRKNGYEVAQCIRAEPWGTRMFLVALTGWGQLEDKQRAMEAGFDQHLTKPVSRDTLDELLRQVPRSSRPREPGTLGQGS